MNTTMTRSLSPVGPIEAARRGLARLERFPAAVTTLLIRLGVAAVFFKSGLTKIASWETTIVLFRDEYRVPILPPEIAAYLGSAAELTCPILIALGLGARFGAAALLGMTAVIQLFVYPENWAEHLLWAGAFVLVITRGAGALSVDHLIRRSTLG